MTTDALKHYDRFSFLIDLFRDWPYRQARRAAIDELHLEEAETVIDLFCGSGVNFEPLLEGMGASGKIIAIDGSRELLARARKRIEKRQLDGARVEIHQMDVTEQLDRIGDSLREAETPPKLLITLALGIFPDYDELFGKLFEMMPTGTRIVLMEIYFARKSLACRVVNWIGSADCTRRTWEPLQRRVSDYRQLEFKLVTSKLIVGSGTKSSRS